MDCRPPPPPDGRAVGSGLPDADFPADPYPDAVPPFSFVHLDECSRPLTFDGYWRVGGSGGAELDLWLAGLGAPPSAAPTLGQAAAFALTGDPAPDDGLAATTIGGAPDPDDWPAVLFVYGTLQPGQRAWPRLATHVIGAPRRATVAGRVCNTGPRLSGTAPRWCAPRAGVVRRGARPGAVLSRLDRYEGPQYRRIRIAADDGTDCWTYAWVADRAALTALPDGWRP
jgi:gamma-glutamylcyclotransferase (GGCT)/AIG2-like uncharacterized protein YtfP